MQTLVLNDPGELQGVLDGISHDFAGIDYGDYLLGELDRLAEMEKGFFDSSTGPDGQPWAANAPSTIKKKGHAVVLRGVKGQLPKNIAATKRRPAVKFAQGKNISQFRLARSLTLKSHQSFDDAIREGIATSSGGMLKFGTSVEYSTYNEYGTDRIPARPHVGMNEKHLDGVVQRVLDYTIEKLKQ